MYKEFDEYTLLQSTLKKYALKMFKFGNKHITIGSIFNAVGTNYFLFKYYLNYMFTVGFDYIGFCHLTCNMDTIILWNRRVMMR